MAKTDEEGEYHEVTEEPGDRIAALEEQVKLLREALEKIATIIVDDDDEDRSMSECIAAGEDAEGQLFDAIDEARAALEATKEGA